MRIRRMVGHLGSRVLKLVRVELGPLTLQGLTIGSFRELSRAEVEELRRVAAFRA